MMKFSLSEKHPIGLLAMLAVAVAMLVGCESSEPPVKVDVGNGFKVQKLFTHEGCTVSRFYSDGDKFFTRCEGAASSSVNWTSGSKTKTHHISMTGYAND